jgi:hypothetical protein
MCGSNRFLLKRGTCGNKFFDGRVISLKKVVDDRNLTVFISYNPLQRTGFVK